MKPRAIFLDRDGTLNPDPGYINHPDGFNLFPGVAEALRRLKEAGFLLILVTNQSGIARKFIEPANLCKIHHKLQGQLAKAGVALDRIYVCPHHPDDHCECRKPKPGLALRAIADLSIDPTASFLIGDRGSDIKMALAAGLTPVHVGEKPLKEFPDILSAPTLPMVVNNLLKKIFSR